ncbi:MAG: lasso peptide biosynthesis B2 protein [Acidimicrobiia bacterium]
MRPSDKVRLAVRVWCWFLVVHLELRRRPLPQLVSRLDAAPPRPLPDSLPPIGLGRVVVRALTLGVWRPRCLITALVAFRLLREAGHPANLVIGLPAEAENEDAHAWVEIGGVDVGPPPGKGLHQELVRYPAGGRAVRGHRGRLG